MASPLTKVNVSKMSIDEVIGVQVQKENIELYIRVQMEEKLQQYCERTGQNYENAAKIFFDDTPFQECYCKGVIVARGTRCHRIAKRGTNYCGFHQEQGKQHAILRPPKRPTAPTAASHISQDQITQMLGI